MNHVHKDNKYLVSIIITLGGDIRGGDTMFYDGLKTSGFGSGSHVLKCLHGKIIFSPFEKDSMKVLIGEVIEPQFPLPTQNNLPKFLSPKGSVYNLCKNKIDKKVS